MTRASSVRAAIAFTWGAVILPGVDIGLASRGQLPIRPILVLSALVAAWTALGGFGRPMIAVSRKNLGPLLAVLGLVASIMLTAISVRARLGDEARNMVLPALNVVALLTTMAMAMRPAERKALLVGAATGLVVIGVSILADLVAPGTFSQLETRAAGLPENPNVAAFVVVALSLLWIDFGKERRRDLFIMAGMAILVAATLSRGGLVMVVLLIGIYLVRPGPEGLTMRSLGRPLAVALIVLAGTFGAEWIFTNSEGFQIRAAQERISELTTGSVFGEIQDDARWTIAQDYWRHILERPFTGWGVGYQVGDQGAHNMILRLWAESGILAPFFFLMVFGTSLLVFLRRRSTTGLAFLAISFVYAMVNHNLLEERTFLLVLGLILGMSVRLEPWRTPGPQHDWTRRRPDPAPAAGSPELDLEIFPVFEAPGAGRE